MAAFAENSRAPVVAGISVVPGHELAPWMVFPYNFAQILDIEMGVDLGGRKILVP